LAAVVIFPSTKFLGNFGTLQCFWKRFYPSIDFYQLKVTEKREKFPDIKAMGRGFAAFLNLEKV